MSTYNGGIYIKEQLDSICNQKFNGYIEVLIRDDGSNDNTLKILNDYKTTSNRRLNIIKANNVGVQRSFLELIKIAGKADYYFYSDQDDIWKENKIARAINMMSSVKSNEGVLYCSNYALVNQDLKLIENNVIPQRPDFSVLRVLFYNEIPGCTIGFDYKFILNLKCINIDSIIMHDSVSVSLASAIGKIIYDNVPMIYHRIHLNNVVGMGHKKVKPFKWIKQKILLVVRGDDYDMSILADEILKNFTNKMSPSDKRDFVLLRDFKKSLKNTIKLLKHKDSKNVLDRTTLSIRFKILLHIF